MKPPPPGVSSTQYYTTLAGIGSFALIAIIALFSQVPSLTFIALIFLGICVYIYTGYSRKVLHLQRGLIREGVGKAVTETTFNDIRLLDCEVTPTAEGNEITPILYLVQGDGSEIAYRMKPNTDIRKIARWVKANYPVTLTPKAEECLAQSESRATVKTDDTDGQQ